ncbi:MAG: glycosyl hydrolase [Chloroflexi bacterium]|nr:MAG: glycosyl hydrolase [Chloroflexota bacterium]
MEPREEAGALDPRAFGSLEWRCVGPHRGGRVPAVVGHPTDPATYYFGACAGGVWKSTDAGQYWENVSDGYFKLSAVGALAIADADPNIVWAGMGETRIRGNVSHGDGVYKSTDGGQSWTHMGLSDTHAISRIRIHPSNPDIVYVGAFGHVWGQNEERGVFRTRDGGKTWERVLYRSPKAGAIDLSMDPNNPRILYAAIWEAQRYPYKLVSGGPDSSIYKTTDGGDTWTELTRNPGLPAGTLGKIGIAASPARTNRVWALIEAEDGALFRSDDGGATWQRLSELGDLRRRAWYYTHIYADPQDAETVYVLNLKMWKSVDGGSTFTAIPTPHGDNQDLWIDPRNPLRMIEGNDGGACVTFNGGLSWSSIQNQPTAQFYHVTTDDRTPYRLYGSQQDNTALVVPSASARGAITQTEWYEPGGGESGYIALKPGDPDIVFAGAIGSGPGNGRLIRFNNRTGETRVITVWPEVQGSGRGAESHRYRFQWTFPICFSPHDPNVLYVTSNVVHRSTDEGMSWEVVSPDLTRNDPETLKPSGGPITRDNSGAEVYGTIFSFVESPLQPGFFWAGSDDGLIHVSEGGGNWENVSIADLPEWALISVIEPSPHDPAAAYVAATRYKHDDFQPYLYKTSDYGRTWTRIDAGIPRDAFTRVVRADPARAGLLYAGTESGVYVSFDDGGSWQRMQANLPVCPIHDLLVRGTDLIAATHGRSFWILDDLSPLHQVTAEQTAAALHVFTPRPAQRFKTYGRMGDASVDAKSYGRAGGIVVTNYQRTKPTGEVETIFLDAGKNPPDGVIFHYWIGAQPEGPLSLTIRDAGGNVVRTYSSDKAQAVAGDIRATAQVGMNRFIWNMRYPSAKPVPTTSGAPVGLQPDALLGPVAVPGRYFAEFAIGDTRCSVPFEIQADPRVAGTQEDLQQQFDFLLAVRDKVSEVHSVVERIQTMTAQITTWEKRINDAEVSALAGRLKERLAAIEEVLCQPKAASPLLYPNGINERLALLTVMAGSSDTRPTKQMLDVFEKLRREAEPAAPTHGRRSRCLTSSRSFAVRRTSRWPRWKRSSQVMCTRSTKPWLRAGCLRSGKLRFGQHICQGTVERL